MSIYAPRIDTTAFTDPSGLWATIIPDSKHRPQKDDEDSGPKELPPPLDRSEMNAAADEAITSRFMSRDRWARDINVDDKPVDHSLPTREKGAVDYIVKESKFNGSLGASKSPAADKNSTKKRDGVKRNDVLQGDDMREDGLDPCLSTEDGQTVEAKTFSVLPCNEPSTMDEPQNKSPGCADYDFGSFEMTLNGPPNQILPIEILCAPSHRQW